MKRVLCLLLAVVMLAGFEPPTDAVTTVIFTAVNDTLLPLADDTMPFYSGGAIYAPSSAFDGTDLGIYYSRSRDKNTALFYKQRNVIIFDLAAGTIETNNGAELTGTAIVRGDVVFFPLDVMCSYFNLEYSYTRITYGYLLRIKSDSVVLSDAKFIDAANSSMAQRYARYGRPQAEPVQTEEPPPEPPPTQETAQRTFYPVVACTDPATAETLIRRFGAGRATYLFPPDGVDGADELLRCLAAGGGTTALRVNAADGAEQAIAQIEAGNRTLWAAANCKTRLVWLDGASEDTARRVAEAGYCPISAAVNLSGIVSSASRTSARIISAADARRGSCCVFLGTDVEIAGDLGALLAALRSSNCTSARLTEVTLS